MHLQRGLIVSCQAGEGEPLHGCNIMQYMARAAVAGGAVGIRALYYDIESIKREVDVPVVGLAKRDYPDSEVYITPTKKEVDAVLAAGADCVALDATLRPRPHGEDLADLVAYIRQKAPGTEIMADIATLQEAKNAEALGFDYVSTTLRGYTRETRGAVLPDIDFLAQVAAAVKKSKVIAEGGICEAGDIERINAVNPYAVVIGSAITRPAVTTEHFVRRLRLL